VLLLRGLNYNGPWNEVEAVMSALAGAAQRGGPHFNFHLIFRTQIFFPPPAPTLPLPLTLTLTVHKTTRRYGEARFG
jgi:hypothetical protein